MSDLDKIYAQILATRRDIKEIKDLIIPATPKQTEDKIVTASFLEENPNVIFVFGDNLKRYGTGGAAALRYITNTYGFVTKKAPTYKDEDFYKPEDYITKYLEEVYCLRERMIKQPDKLFLISKIGGGIANKYKIFEEVIEPTIRILLKDLSNKEFLWE